MSTETLAKHFTGIARQEMQCWCSVQFAIPSALYNYYVMRNEESPGSFGVHCPLGHSMVPANPDRRINQVRDELTRAKQRAEQLEADAKYQRHLREVAEAEARTQERSARAYKGVTTRLKRRAVKGVCPCCSHKFKDLATHMKRDHPDFNPDKHAEALTKKSPADFSGSGVTK